MAQPLRRSVKTRQPRFPLNGYLWSVVTFAGVGTVLLLVFAAGCAAPPAKISATAPVSPILPAPPLVTGHSQIATKPAEIAAYAGDAACAGCHRQIWRSHRASGHAMTLTPVTLTGLGAQFRLSRKITDSTTDTTFQMDTRNGRCVLYSQGPVGTETIPAEWALGSARHGQTYLGRAHGSQWLTLRLSYYTGIKGWDYTPEQQPDPTHSGDINGQVLKVSQVENCLSCHATTLAMRWNGPDPVASHAGVGCERCHGPGRAHLAAMRGARQAKGQESAKIEDLNHTSSSRISALCGECHRAESAPRPDAPDPDNNLTRFKSTALEMSACFQKGRILTCVTCHDPHMSVRHEAKSYEAACLSCHNSTHASPAPGEGGSTQVCKINPRTGCIPCHMPAQKPLTFPHTTMHNHRIKIWH